MGKLLKRNMVTPAIFIDDKEWLIMSNSFVIPDELISEPEEQIIKQEVTQNIIAYHTTICTLIQNVNHHLRKSNK